MQETNLSDFNLNELLEGEFEKLTSSEKAVMFIYRNHLLKNTDVAMIRGLIDKVNEIHGKYQNFHIGCVPGQLQSKY